MTAPVGRKSRPQQPSKLGRDLIFIGVTLVFLLSVYLVGINWQRLLDLPSDLARIFGQMFLPPDWSSLPLAVEQMIVTIAIAWIGTLIGAALSLPIGSYRSHEFHAVKLWHVELLRGAWERRPAPLGAGTAGPVLARWRGHAARGQRPVFLV